MRIQFAISLVSLSAVTTNAYVPHRVQRPLSIKPVFSSTTTTVNSSPFKTSRNNNDVVNYGKTARMAEVAYPVDGSECSDEIQIRMTRHYLCVRLTDIFLLSPGFILISFSLPFLACDPFDPESSEFCTVDPEEIDGSLNRTIRLTVLFALWYVLNIGYNIGNKSVLNALPLPWTAATVELFFGFPYVAFLWLSGLRKAPKLSFGNVRTLSSQAFFLAATHVAGVVSFGAGAISFTHILKATEPVWSALILAIGFGEFLPVPVYLSLVPIMGGVGLASLKELSFTWLSFTAGTISAVTSAAKAILSKKVLDGKPMGENLTPANMFAVLTILGFLFILPASLMIEGPAKISAAYTAALAAGYTKAQLIRLLGVSGFLYYLYNEVAFLALSEVAPVTHAVANVSYTILSPPKLRHCIIYI